MGNQPFKIDQGLVKFRGERNGERVAIPDSATHIGNCAFQNCSSLGSSIADVHIPDSVTHIGNCAFLDGRGRAGYHLPRPVWDWGAEAFPSHLLKCQVPNPHGCPVKWLRSSPGWAVR